MSESNEMGIFRSQNVQNFIDFKWNQYAFKFHLLGTIVQLAYLVVLFIYVNINYIEFDPKHELGFDTFIILVFVAYPMILETLQMFKIGLITYITDTDNWLDITFVYGSVAMAITHYFQGPQHFASKVLIVLVLLSAFR